MPGAGDGVLVDSSTARVEEQRLRRDVSLGAVEPYIALALLLRIVEGMCVEKRPHKLARNIFQTEFKVSVLVNGMMAAVKGSGPNVETLLVGDFFRPDQTRSVAGTRRSDRGVERMSPGIEIGRAHV